jgi:hypothetical protein
VQLRRGKVADLILADGSPDVDLGALRNISMVVKNGQVIAEAIVTTVRIKISMSLKQKMVAWEVRNGYF